MPCDHDSKCLDDRIVVDISSAVLAGLHAFAGWHGIMNACRKRW